MSTHRVKQILHTRGSSWNPNCNTLESDRPQHDRPTACVIVQQYSSDPFVSLRPHSRKEKSGARFKSIYFSQFFIF